MIKEGIPFELVEDAIDAAPFAPHHKSALWLLGWSLRDPVIQRRDDLLMMGAFAADEYRGHRDRSDFDPSKRD